MHIHTSAPPLDPMTNLRIVLNAYVNDADLALLAAGLGMTMPAQPNANGSAR